MGVAAFATLYAITTAISSTLAPASTFPMRLRQSLAASVLGAALFAALVLAFSAIASALRVASGYSETYEAGAQVGLWLTYGLSAAGVAPIGRLFSRSNDGSVGISLVSVLLFMLAALPFTELLTECYASVTLILRPTC